MNRQLKGSNKCVFRKFVNVNPISHTEQPQGIDMKLLAAIFAVSVATQAWAIEAAAQARLIGYYSNVRTEGNEDPHFISGYNITLYRRNAETIGRVAVAIGSPEPVRATIRQLAFNPATKRLTFTAEYSEGLSTNPIKGEPDREALQVLTFTGVVKPNSITGKMGVRDFYCSTCRPVVERVKLKRIAEMGRTGDLRTILP